MSNSSYQGGDARRAAIAKARGTGRRTTGRSSNSQKREDYIVYNPTKSLHMISTNKWNLSVGSGKMVDLTHEDSDIIRHSMELTHSIRAGFLVRISREQAMMLAEREAQRMRAELQAQAQRGKAKRVKGRDGKVHEADLYDLNDKNSAERGQADVMRAGLANDPLHFAELFRRANEEAQRRGGFIDAVEFHKLLENHNGGNLNLDSVILGDKSSNAGQSARAYVAVPDGDGSTAAASTQFRTTNPQRGNQRTAAFDPMFADQEATIQNALDVNGGYDPSNIDLDYEAEDDDEDDDDLYGDDDDDGLGETIDLNEDFDDSGDDDMFPDLPQHGRVKKVGR